MSDASTTAQLVRQLLNSKGRATLTIESDSMAPLFVPMDCIQIEAVSVDQLRQGDIVTVVAKDALYTHRYFQTLVHHNRRYLLTRGDQPLAYDPAWLESQLLGRVVKCEKQSASLILSSGIGRRLNRHLTTIARFENWLYGQGTPNMAQLANFETRLLGRWWRQDRVRLTLLRAMRGFWLRWSRLWVYLAVMYASKAKSVT